MTQTLASEAPTAAGLAGATRVRVQTLSPFRTAQDSTAVLVSQLLVDRAFNNNCALWALGLVGIAHLRIAQAERRYSCLGRLCLSFGVYKRAGHIARRIYQTAIFQPRLIDTPTAAPQRVVPRLASPPRFCAALPFGNELVWICLLRRIELIDSDIQLQRD